ncbi:cellulose biosynthesis protein BcsQ [Serratia sp. UGAL515B_01]|uniref:cellulose biosynthesis protein BcsQ n=1 Tax=Serratia sp. UGAL515B_01 TaxID=2986763 RepID=UPI0029559B7E|nr:cellulose biosynthesis protein BcsQ [Serratia sp. UGAL515B_01]WON77080.1 cellulose biosynthesis protein BcsQ [Serratia sp. UGAL515B_01]
MPVIALQGLRGGIGVTSLTAALAWALQQLGESVLAIDLSPDNLLRLHFNMPFELNRGWARADLDGAKWQQGAMRYGKKLDFLPFGRLSLAEQRQISQQDLNSPGRWQEFLALLCDSGQYRWILLDIPAGNTVLIEQQLALADGVFLLLSPDASCHARLHQQPTPVGCRFLINQFSSSSMLQQDLHQLWLQTLNGVLPFVIHRDEALVEALAIKQPVGEYNPESLAADEILTLANWCLLNLSEEAR